MMSNVVCTIFELSNRRGLFCPKIAVSLTDKQGATEWQINAGGTRCYVTHADSENLEIEAPLSHFMASRLAGAVLMAKGGLFEFISRGRITFSTQDNFQWSAELNLEVYAEEIERIHKDFDQEIMKGWFNIILESTFLRRAIDDLVLSLQHPSEAFIFLYRGFEWIRDGLDVTTSELAAALGVKERELKELGRISNNETGVRHASSSGKKLVADAATYTSWTCGLIDAINFGRRKLDPTFQPMSAVSVAELVKMSAILEPYP